MTYDEQEASRSKGEGETSAAVGDVSTPHTDYTAGRFGGHFSASAAIAVLVILAAAIVAILGLIVWSMHR